MSHAGTVADRAASNPDLRFETVQGKTRIVVAPLDRLEDTESLRALRPAIQGRMPKAAIPDLFLEVMRRTGFAQAFTHLSERQSRVEHFETSLCAALIAEACNIGTEPVSRQDIAALRRERLAWLSQNFIRPDTIAAASACIVSAHAALPLVIAKLRAEWDADCRNGTELWRRLCAAGFSGGLRVVTEWATRQRRSEKADVQLARKAPRLGC